MTNIIPNTIIEYDISTSTKPLQLGLEYESFDTYTRSIRIKGFDALNSRNTFYFRFNGASSNFYVPMLNFTFDVTTQLVRYSGIYKSRIEEFDSEGHLVNFSKWFNSFINKLVPEDENHPLNPIEVRDSRLDFVYNKMSTLYNNLNDKVASDYYRGAKGEKGEPGQDGADGATGPVGPTGPTGPQGLQGPAGSQGIQGIQGLKGDKGDKGDTGEQGIQGESGVHIGSSEPTDDSTVWIDTESGATVIPKARVEQTTNGAVIYCTDEDGTTTATIDTSDITRRLNALWDYSRGIVYDFETDDDDAYSKNVPSGGKVASVLKVGGKSVVVNQFISGINSTTVNGISITRNSDESYTVNGTASATTWILITSYYTMIGHIYYLRGCPSGGSANTFSIYNDGGGLTDTGQGTVASATASKRIYIRITSGTTVSNLVFKPQLFDLTQMFGSGNEPSLAECRQIFNADYYPYNSGTLVSSQTDKVVVRDSDSTVTSEITTSFPTLRSAGSVYDYIDCVNGKLHRRVGSVDLGSLSWTYVNSYCSFSSNSIINEIARTGSYQVTPNIVCAKYSTTYQNDMWNRLSNTCISEDANNGRIYVNDTSYTDAQSFKNAMSGVMLYYELATEVITDITIPSGLDEMTVETNGSITFHNADDTLHLIVPNEVEYLVALAEVN